MPQLSLNRMINKLSASIGLSDDEKQAILNLPVRMKDFGRGEDIVCEGDRPTQCCLISEGLLCRYKSLPDGERQIVALQVPGDLPDLQSFHMKIMDHSLAAVSTSRLCLISHRALNDLIAGYPRIAVALWRDSLLDAAILREWIFNIGSREAYRRLAHLVCEIFVRLEAVGLTNGDNSFKFPITQKELGEATGLSPVHVNRTLVALRETRVLALERPLCTILDLERLVEVAAFDSTYLHLPGLGKAA